MFRNKRGVYYFITALNLGHVHFFEGGGVLLIVEVDVKTENLGLLK